MELQYYNFHGDELIMWEMNGEKYVSISHMCDAIGIDKKTQREKIQKDQRFQSHARQGPKPSWGGPPPLGLNIKKIEAWLYTINPAAVRYDVQEKLIQYQEECGEALHAFWTKGIALRDVQQPDIVVYDRKVTMGELSVPQARELMEYMKVQHELNSIFGVPAHASLLMVAQAVNDYRNVDVTEQLAQSEVMRSIPPTEKFEGFQDLNERYGTKRGFISNLLEATGHQVRTGNGTWEPTQKALDRGIVRQNTWSKLHEKHGKEGRLKSGYNLHWNVAFIGELLGR